MAARKPEPIDHLIAANIRFYRVRRGLSRTMLAARVELSEARLGALEMANRSITAAELLRIARALETPVGQFFAGDVPA